MKLFHSDLVALSFWFILFISTLGYSFLFRNLFKLSFSKEEYPLSFYLAGGFFLFSYISFSVGVFGGGFSFYPQVFIFGLGFLFFVLFRYQAVYFFLSLKNLVQEFLQNKKYLIWLLFPFLYYFCRFVSSLMPQQHNDALYYHLAAGKFWVLEKTIKVLISNPSFAQSTIVEALFAFPQFFLGTLGVFSHVTTQIYAQLTHFFFGQFLTTALVFMILRESILDSSKNLPKIFFLSWVITTLACIEWTGTLAKTDYFVVLGLFCAYLGFLKFYKTLETVHLILFSFFALISFVIKMMASPFLLSMFLSLFFIDAFRKKFLKHSLVIILVIVICFFSLWYRNLKTTDALFFPAFDKKIISDWWIAHNASFFGLPYFHGDIFWWFKNKLLERSFLKFLFFFGFFGFLFLRKKTLEKILAFLNFLFLFLMIRANADGRFGGFALSFFLMLGVLGVEDLLKKIPRKISTIVSGFIFFFGFGINIPIDLPFKFYKKYLFKDVQTYVNEFHAYQNSKNWINENIKQWTPILAIADKANFYLDKPTLNFAESRKWQKILEESKDARDFLIRVKNENIRYIYLQKEFIYPEDLKKIWTELQSIAQKIKVMEQDKVMLLDLSLIR
jgi:hypothetical protein